MYPKCLVWRRYTEVAAVILGVWGAFAPGVIGELVDATGLRDGNLAKITQSARELVLAVQSARAKSVVRNSH